MGAVLQPSVVPFVLQTLHVELTEVPGALQALGQQEGFGKSVRLDSIYWNVMKLLGFTYVCSAA